MLNSEEKEVEFEMRNISDDPFLLSKKINPVLPFHSDYVGVVFCSYIESEDVPVITAFPFTAISYRL